MSKRLARTAPMEILTVMGASPADDALGEEGSMSLPRMMGTCRDQGLGGDDLQRSGFGVYNVSLPRMMGTCRDQGLGSTMYLFHG